MLELLQCVNPMKTGLKCEFSKMLGTRIAQGNHTLWAMPSRPLLQRKPRAIG